ncbi:uncharacterized protein EV420DRAFT_1649675 [Desarmillaria tabescens]|uniref:Uncharacterized protein n=1 Tax=Armillaria tabescens TaxID=1929756 RepID=A0AA39MQG5_ARMTA|nr:uncharacterized protein EV420DRAFT_1649675 [Desarmillaria tabescens]KAK0442503.1 hypothetical protein EV420DRAFT_1649675 [Desarmillaria tabescens]
MSRTITPVQSPPQSNSSHLELMPQPPSDEPLEPTSYHPRFGWDFDVNDSKILRAKSRELYALREGVRDRSLNIHYVFTVTFPAAFRKSDSPEARDLPLFACVSGTYNITITSFIQNFSDLDIPEAI